MPAVTEPPRTPLAGLQRVLGRLEAGLAAIALLALLALGLVQILAREVFASALSGVEPLARMLVLYVLFLGAAQAAGAGRHLTLDLLPRLLPPGLRPYLARLLGLAAALVSAALAWAGWQFWSLEWAYTPAGQRGLFALALIIPLGFALLALRLGLRALGPQPAHISPPRGIRIEP